ncbi:NADP-specific glutamate dehydrogenase [Rhodohalobacter sulfatireducens]|uniref:Glutamate dehydrogenase n=1 Tax=Rhodohalobacter sulfatireducens TaxID=2911366 RepID=A0ABS9K819_9BACT|nr:NADP-specific glutamate dehydrogenase [Rhodohalobacter sulfatireducens]MCG2586986.1 NADP-specific glutamate dehydrogenase [Rhodohalobacter sulfatireducens]MDR9363981.1 NADP-specific glutamate dehydrogenase [Balneolaceae bacterium]MDR9407763.1 NADP-specific glutamate dehydrogenase [Balneolaceae bacterium]
MYDLERVLQTVKKHNAGEKEFHQAVREVYEDILPYIADKPRYEKAAILERLTEPDRIIRFRVTWMDDNKKIHVNRAWRVQFNNSIGPYKGGLRFHPSVNAGILKFLGFEQTFKNALTSLPIGGAKGGSDFNPKGKSDSEIFRFCHSLMDELQRYIGEDTDIPAGDIGVGKREISYLFGQYKKLTNRFTGTITGKDINFGGSLIRTEATGYGLIYFVQNMLEEFDDDLEEKEVSISGSGNVALYACQKAMDLGAKVVTLSDSDGTIYDKEGIDREKFEFVKELKEVKYGRIKEYADEFSCEYLEGETPWSIPCDIALPCATQNEVDLSSAKTLLKNGLMLLAEGANMPCSADATRLLRDSDVLYAPGKASNAGGVAVSGLEISQNELRMSWSAEEVNDRLQSIMKEIHKKCKEHGEDDDGNIDYMKGANIAGFKKVADAMLAFGPV